MTNDFRVYGYLRASTKEQNANRAKDSLLHFAKAQLQPAEAGGLISRLEVGITLKRYWQYYLTDARQNGY